MTRSSRTLAEKGLLSEKCLIVGRGFGRTGRLITGPALLTHSGPIPGTGLTPETGVITVPAMSTPPETEPAGSGAASGMSATRGGRGRI
ncbi:hypothetical protein Sm713_16520 [Streptomyces sp. TS71-3]|nr:hypothetical protein Sm713_16520 [Streptomyces sp. TS71-3]